LPWNGSWLVLIPQDGSAVYGKLPVTFLRVFNIKEAEQRSVTVTGWEKFDQHPDLILFEGYITETVKAYLERKRT
jgi:hypothetical protein